MSIPCPSDDLSLRPADDCPRRADCLAKRAAAIPYQPFPTHALPGVLRRFVEQAAAVLGCDAACIALPALAAYSARIGATRELQLKAGWSEPCVLWTAVVAEPGALPAAALRLATDFLWQQQADLMHAQEVAREKYRTGLFHYERSLEHPWPPRMPWDPLPEPPAAPLPCARLVVTDLRVDRLASVLAGNPRGLLAVAEDLASWLGGSLRLRYGGPGPDAAQWQAMHQGGPLLVEGRGSRQAAVLVRRAVVSVTGGVLPGVLARVLTPEFREAGLAGRMLLAMPPRLRRQWSEAEMEPAVQQPYEAVGAALGKLGFGRSEQGAPLPLAVTLSPAAKARWIELYNAWGERASEAAAGEAAGLAQLPSHAARLALLHHLVEKAAAGQNEAPLELESLEAGAALAEWFLHEGDRIYALLAEREQARELERLLEQIRARGGTVTVRTVMRMSRQHPTSRRAEAALDELVEAGLGRWVTLPTSERGVTGQRAFCLTESLPSTTAEREYQAAASGESVAVSTLSTLSTARQAVSDQAAASAPSRQALARQAAARIARSTQPAPSTLSTPAGHPGLITLSTVSAISQEGLKWTRPLLRRDYVQPYCGSTSG